MPIDGEARARVFEQLFFHASGLGPAFWQASVFQRQATEPQPLAIKRFRNETRRTLGILDDVLANQAFAAGNSFSIVDIAHFGWLWRHEFAGLSFDDAPHVGRWYEAVANRPAVQRAMARVIALVPSA